MTNSVLVIYPTHLFNNISRLTDLKQYSCIYIFEEPIYFYDKVYKPFKPNKVKLAFLRASMKYFFDTLKNENNTIKDKIKYISYSDSEKFYKRLSSNHHITFFDPLDYDLEKKNI